MKTYQYAVIKNQNTYEFLFYNFVLVIVLSFATNFVDRFSHGELDRLVELFFMIWPGGGGTLKPPYVTGLINIYITSLRN